MAEEIDFAARIEDFLNSFKTVDGDTPYRDAIERLETSDKRSVDVHFDHIASHDPELAKALREHPDLAIEAASTAIHRIARVVIPDYARAIETFHMRFREVPDKVSVRGIRSEHIGKLIKVDAMVTRVSDVKPLLVEGVFKCRQCGNVMVIPQLGQYTPPPFCSEKACGTRRGPFELVPEKSKFIDWQKIRLQEKPEELPAGTLPRALDCFLHEDLVDLARPGDPVRIVGVLKSSQDVSAVRRKAAPTFSVFLMTNSVDVLEREADRLEITPKEKEEILKLAQDPLIHRKIINSVAPSIYGLTDIKEAVILQLFGGVAKELSDGIKIRGDSNILLVGDPGTAKSQLLKYVVSLAPRGLYTSGKGSTAAGLTAAVLRDPDTEGLVLEAGALVLADRGLAAIDEFDKMRPQDRTAIHEAMEQHTISIAKAGIVATLNARTAILAAANPVLGRYVAERPFDENVNLPVPLLSRFDLIFILRDKPDSTEDERMASHIIELHRRRDIPKDPPISKDILRKYIAHARRAVSPVLTEEALKVLKAFYLEMRKMGESENAPVPITARQLESLIRLAEAHAKMALREKVLADDAQSAVRLVHVSLSQVGIDPETGQFDIDSIVVGRPKSQSEKMRSLASIIRELEKEIGSAVPLEKIQQAAELQGISSDYIQRAIEQLLKEGVIYMPRNEMYRMTKG